MTDEVGKDAVEKARSVLRANLSADFDDLAPHLLSLLEHLPILDVDASILQNYPANKAVQSDMEGIVAYLRREWIATEASDYESIGASSIGDAVDLLIVTFRGNIWSVGQMEKRIIVARIGEDWFKCWRYYASEGVWGSVVGQYEVPRLDPTMSIRTGSMGEEASSLSRFCTQVRELLERLVRSR